MELPTICRLSARSVPVRATPRAREVVPRTPVAPRDDLARGVRRRRIFSARESDRRTDDDARIAEPHVVRDADAGTEHGSDVDADRRPDRDADADARTRRRGADDAPLLEFRSAERRRFRDTLFGELRNLDARLRQRRDDLARVRYAVQRDAERRGSVFVRVFRSERKSRKRFDLRHDRERRRAIPCERITV